MRRCGRVGPNTDPSVSHHSDPVGFRGDPSAIFRVVYLLENPAGYYLDALRVSDAPINDRPVAGDDQFAVPFASPLQVPAPGVLANDHYRDGDPLTLAVVSQPAIGTATLNQDGSFVYAFPADLVGSVSFTYQIADAGGPGNVATVTLTREGIVHVTNGAATIIAGGGAGKDWFLSSDAVDILDLAISEPKNEQV